MGHQEPSFLEKTEQRLIKSLISRDAEFEAMQYYIFHALIKNPNIRREVIKTLPQNKNCKPEDLEMWVELCDKDQFKRYASGESTFAQFKKQIAARRFNVNYTVLDDIIDDLPESCKGEELKKAMPMLRRIYGKNPTIADCVNTNLQPHEYNEKCLRSVHQKAKRKKDRPHHFFTSQERWNPKDKKAIYNKQMSESPMVEQDQNVSPKSEQKIAYSQKQKQEESMKKPKK